MNIKSVSITKNLVISIATGFIFILFCFGFFNYPGSKFTYVAFSVVCNSLLFLSIGTKSLFFELFIAGFIWLGFWLKLTLKIAFFDGNLVDPVGMYDHSPSALDKGLWVASLGITAIIVAIYFRKIFFKGYAPSSNKTSTSSQYLALYERFRKLILFVFVLLITFVALTNFKFSIYQRGTITGLVLPFGVNGIYKWLLIFGFSSFSAVLLNLELQLKKDLSFTVMLISMMESFISNVSMISRGMVMNSASLIYGAYASTCINKIRIKTIKYAFFIVVFMILFVASIQITNSLRDTLFYDSHQTKQTNVLKKNQVKFGMFTDRWVGIEGILAVTSYPNLGWELFKNALNEKYDEHAISFYDKNLLKDSPYINTDRHKHHFMSLPGYIAFLFYPGSYAFLFISIFSVSMFSVLLEFIAYKSSGENMIFAALISQTVAYRLTNFGYVPSQSYLLFGSILLTCTLLYLSRMLFGAVHLNLSAK